MTVGAQQSYTKCDCTSGIATAPRYGPIFTELGALVFAFDLSEVSRIPSRQLGTVSFRADAICG